MNLIVLGYHKASTVFLWREEKNIYTAIMAEVRQVKRRGKGREAREAVSKVKRGREGSHGLVKAVLIL